MWHPTFLGGDLLAAYTLNLPADFDFFWVCSGRLLFYTSQAEPGQQPCGCDKLNPGVAGNVHCMIQCMMRTVADVAAAEVIVFMEYFIRDMFEAGSSA